MPVPRHYAQPQPWGCLYYAFAALTGEELFEHVEDCSLVRFAVRLAERGHLLLPLYRDHYALEAGGPFAPDGLWRRLAADAASDGVGAGDVERGDGYRLLLGVPSLRYPEHGGGHTVGALFGPDRVRVFDPGRRAELALDLDAFLQSPYARAFEVFALQPLELDAYEPIHGPSLPHARAWAERRAALLADGQRVDGAAADFHDVPPDAP